MSNALNVNFLSTLLSFFLKNCTNLSHPSFCNWAPTACPVLLCDPEGWSPVVVPLLPITAYRLTQNLPHHFHIAVFHCFHCCVVQCVVCFFSLFLYPFHSLVFCSPSVLPPLPPIPSNLHAYIPPCPPGSGCSTSAAAVLAKNRCPRNTSPVREKE